MNSTLYSICNRAPASLKPKITLFLLNYGNSDGGFFDFFSHFPSALLSVLFLPWRRPPETLEKAAITAHAMSLFLHSLDDHLHDGDIQTTHLLLHLRTLAWTQMEMHMGSLAACNRDNPHQKKRIINDKLDEYFANIYEPPEPPDLQEFLKISQSQSATWQITPMLLAEPEEETFVESVIGLFMQMYRLQDDLDDMIPDIKTGQRNSIYYSLPDEIKPLYLDISNQEIVRTDAKRQEAMRMLDNEIENHHIIERLVDLVSELSGRLINLSLEFGRERFACLIEETIPASFGSARQINE